MNSARLRALWVTAAFALGCKTVIGDSCSVNTDCSINGDRQCDTTQHSGYCTVANCDPNSCPDDALCVAFDAQSTRLERRYCMSGCEQDSDCRGDTYRCLRPDPAACVGTAPNGTLPDGRTCNVLVDTVSRKPGYCVQVGR